MQTTVQPTVSRADVALGGSARRRRQARVSGILSFVLLFSSLQAFCETVSAGQSVTLSWIPSVDPNVVGYNIYYGGDSGDYTDMLNVGNATSVTIDGLAAGTTYYFAATAYDALGNESAYSSEISYLVPDELPAVQIRAAPDGPVVLTVSGQAGHTYEVQATQDFMAWTVIGTMSLEADGALDFTDTDAANFPQRFYRTHEIP